MSEVPLHLRFDERTHPDPTNRAVAWQDAMSLSVDTVMSASQASRFEASLSFYPFGSTVLVDASFTAHSMMRTKATISRSGNEHVICDVFPHGELKGVFDGRPLSIAAGDCLFMDLRQTFSADVTDGRFIGLVVPRAAFEARRIGATPIHGLHLAGAGPEAGIIGPLLVGAAAQASRLSPSRRNALGAEILGVIAACTGRDETATARKQASSVPAIPSSAHIRRYIDRHASDPGLNSSLLCEVFGLSRTMLYRIFAPVGGIAKVIRSQRADAALRLLGTHPTGLSIETVAVECGFSNARALHRALHEFHNLNPSQIRHHHADAPAGEHKHSAEIARLLDGAE